MLIILVVSWLWLMPSLIPQENRQETHCAFRDGEDAIYCTDCRQLGGRITEAAYAVETLKQAVAWSTEIQMAQ